LSGQPLLPHHTQQFCSWGTGKGYLGLGRGVLQLFLVVVITRGLVGDSLGLEDVISMWLDSATQSGSLPDHTGSPVEAEKF
jgi:hypothetical protein